MKNKNIKPVRPTLQYTLLGKMIKRLLRFGIVKHICFNLGLKGFNKVSFEHIRNGKVINRGFSYNSRVDKGGDLSASLLTGESLNSITSPLPPVYIALSTSTLTPAKGDTTLDGETSVSGLARAVGTVQNYTAPTALDGACSYEVYKEFTNAGATTTIVSSALLDASSSGNLFAEDNLTSSSVLENGDVLKITWTVSL